MNRIYTSYFGRIKKLDIPNAKLYNISNAKFFKGNSYEPLIPPWDLVKGYKDETISKQEYFKIYKERVLSKLDPHKVIKELGDNAILLCYEKPPEFCHRRIVAKWIEYYTDIPVLEI